VNSREDAVYRLQLARGYLVKDESTRTPPWVLVQESEARIGLEKGRRAVALAETIHADMAGDMTPP